MGYIICFLYAEETVVLNDLVTVSAAVNLCLLFSHTDACLTLTLKCVPPTKSIYTQLIKYKNKSRLATQWFIKKKKNLIISSYNLWNLSPLVAQWDNIYKVLFAV